MMSKGMRILIILFSIQTVLLLALVAYIYFPAISESYAAAKENKRIELLEIERLAEEKAAAEEWERGRPERERKAKEEADRRAAAAKEENDRRLAEEEARIRAKEKPRRDAEAGDPDAQYELGLAYATGRGVPEDDAEAAKWYRKAAEQGHARAQYNLGYAYADGKSVPEDDAEAAKWYRKAAEQGYARAQYNLGAMYLNGHGVPEHHQEAVKWWTKAAEQGHVEAQLSLGHVYAKTPTRKLRYVSGFEGFLGHRTVGSGIVKEDEVQAYAWLNIAAANDRYSVLNSGNHSSWAEERKEEVAAQMTKEQIAEAQKLSREMIKANPKLMGD